jgi:hypothetical protein
MYFSQLLVSNDTFLNNFRHNPQYGLICPLVFAMS